jgi:antitoxin VapB
MALYVKDDRARQLAETLADKLGKTKSDVVLAALQEKLDREAKPVSIFEKLEKLWAEHPVPPPTGEIADKAFFDELSGEYERE